jgi:transposase
VRKLLEDAQIKLPSVISDLFGVSGRAMLEAMIAGQRSPRVLAQMARASMRAKIDVLTEALTGHFEDHHAFSARYMLNRIDTLSADIDALTTQIQVVIAPFATQVTQLDEIPGIGVIGAQELIAELGVDMTRFPTRFPTAGHLVSWAKFVPIDHQSAGKGKAGATGKGNFWLAGTLGEIVAGFSRTNTFLGQRYRRLSKRRGTNRAIVAAGNSVLTIIWHLLSDPQARYHDPGAHFGHTAPHTAHRQQDLIRQLEGLTGKKVTLHPRPEPTTV